MSTRDHRPHGPSPLTAETITNIVFGICTVALGGIMIWQGRKAWELWIDRRAKRSPALARDLESTLIPVAQITGAFADGRTTQLK